MQARLLALSIVLFVPFNVEAACPATEIECGRILSAETKLGVQKIYQYCGIQRVRTSRSWALGKCGLNERPKDYVSLCWKKYPHCSCEKSPLYKNCSEDGYYYEEKAPDQIVKR